MYEQMINITFPIYKQIYKENLFSKIYNIIQVISS